jgi:hypothetical protein
MRAKSCLFAVVALAVSVSFAPLDASQVSVWVDNVNGAPTPNASGSPEDMSPVTAAATCHTNGAASTTIQWPSHGIVLPAGNNCNSSNTNCGVLFLGTGSGRQFTEILAVPNNDTLTVEDSFNIAAVSAVNCAVGGRLSNVEVQLVQDMKGDHNSGTHGVSAGGWQIFVVNTGVNYTWTVGRAQLANTNGSGFYGLPSGGIGPTIDCFFDPGTCLRLGGADVYGIEFRNTSGTKTGTVGLTLDLTGSPVISAIIGGDSAATAFETGISWANNARLIVGSLIRNNTTGISATGVSTAVYTVLASVFRSNGVGFSAPATGSQTASFRLLGNVFWEQTTAGVVLGYDEFTGYRAIALNTFHDNPIGLSITNEAGIHNLLFASNLVTGNVVGVSYTGAGVNIERESALVDFNCYGLGPAANGSDISGFLLGPNTISVNPGYRNTSTGDFTPTSSAVTFIAWPPGLDGLTPRVFPGTATISQPRCGAIQPGSSGAFANVGI